MPRKYALGSLVIQLDVRLDCFCCWSHFCLHHVFTVVVFSTKAKGPQRSSDPDGPWRREGPQTCRRSIGIDGIANI